MGRQVFLPGQQPASGLFLGWWEASCCLLSRFSSAALRCGLGRTLPRPGRKLQAPQTHRLRRGPSPSRTLFTPTLLARIIPTWDPPSLRPFPFRTTLPQTLHTTPHSSGAAPTGERSEDVPNSRHMWIPQDSTRKRNLQKPTPRPSKRRLIRYENMESISSAGSLSFSHQKMI